MSLLILYPKPVYDGTWRQSTQPTNKPGGTITGWKPATYVEGTGEKMAAHIAIDLKVNPPQVVHQYPNVNYRFFAGLLPDTFTDAEGSLRSSTGAVIFWGCPQVEEVDDATDPWQPAKTYSTWAVDALKRDMESVISSLSDPNDVPTITNYTQVFKKSIRSNP